MNVATIKMDKQAAKQAYREYRAAVTEKRNKEDEAIKQGYRHLSLGRTLIDLHASMRQAGVDEKNRPRLAIVRSDAKWCRYSNYVEPVFSMEGAYGRASEHRLPRDLLPRFSQTIRALVPLIPAPIRPAGSLDKYFTLWEADWQAVPVDPMLLRHLSGSLYVVLAAWDLTPVEQSVLAGRLTS